MKAGCKKGSGGLNMGCKSSLEFNIDGGGGGWGCWGVWWPPPPWPLGWKGGNGNPPFWGGANGGSNGKFWFDDFSELSFSSHLTTISVAWTSSSSSVKASSLVGCWRKKIVLKFSCCFSIILRKSYTLAGVF